MLLDLRSLQESSGSVANTLSGAAGNYVVTGNPAGFQVARNFAGSAGSYGVTGRDGALQVSRFLSGDAGAYSLAGQSADFAYTPGATDYTLEGLAGSYAITGISASFAYVQNSRETGVSVPSGVKKQYVEIDGKISRVNSYEEAERLISRHKKAKAKDEKKLRILVKKYEVVIPRQKAIVAKEIAEVEQRIDRHWQALAELYEVIDRELSKLDEEEALMVLLQ